MLLEVIYNTGGSTFLENFIGSFIGTITALIIFVLESRRERNKSRKERKENYKSALIYFQLLLTNIIKVVGKQVIAYRDHSENIKNDPLNFHLLQLYITQDIDRILNKLDQERLFQAYLQEFGNSIEVIKEFKEIISIMDYFNSIISQVTTSQEKYLTELHDNLVKYKDISEEDVLKGCIMILENIRNSTSDYKKNNVYASLNAIVVNYHDTSPNPPTVEHIQASLITTLTNTILEQLRSEPEIFEIADDCRRATWLFNDIKFKATIVANEFNAHYEGMKSALKQLEALDRIIKLT